MQLQTTSTVSNGNRMDIINLKGRTQYGRSAYGSAPGAGGNIGANTRNTLETKKNRMTGNTVLKGGFQSYSAARRVREMCSSRRPRETSMLMIESGYEDAIEPSIKF